MCSQGHHLVFQCSPVSQCIQTISLLSNPTHVFSRPSLHVPVVPSHHFMFQWSPVSQSIQTISLLPNLTRVCKVPHPHSPMNVGTRYAIFPPTPLLWSTPLNWSLRSGYLHAIARSLQSHYLHECLKDASSPTKKRTQRCKPREEFTTNDLKALLSAVLNVNPWMYMCGESKDKWQEVSGLVKQANACEGRSADILKNRVYSLLKVVETRGVSTRNYLARDADLFTTISGHLDSVAALKEMEEETRESDHKKVKLAAEAQKTAGLNLCDAMMKGHSHRSLKQHTQDNLFSATGHSDIA
ncbi:hypothetical protein BU17DRAFT_67824 [Hysterangium stoloniferum]|nr:hypothetical protein BU17DRAFT_67824 [Hysterangium stoloniferum]